MVLTGEGKFLLSNGDLQFVYWSVFDDEIDYDQSLMNTGSLSPDEISDAVIALAESTPLRECTTGYRRFNNSGSDNTNVFRPLFTMPQGQQVLPRVRVFEGDESEEISLVTKQQKIIDLHIQKDPSGNPLQVVGPFDRGYVRSDPSTKTFEMGYAADSYPPDHQHEGFLVRVYKSGTDGLQEVGQRHSLNNDLCYSNDLKIFAGGVGLVK